jgi:Thioredoxin-like
VLIGLGDFRGKYVYLSFCNSFSYYCIREFDLLKDIDSRHSNNLAIVTILVDDNYQSMRDLLKANNYNWTFLHYASQPEIIRDYEIKAYPTYYLIGPDGKLIASPAPSPLEGFEEYLFKTMRAKGDI